LVFSNLSLASSILLLLVEKLLQTQFFENGVKTILKMMIIFGEAPSKLLSFAKDVLTVPDLTSWSGFLFSGKQLPAQASAICNFCKHSQVDSFLTSCSKRVSSSSSSSSSFRSFRSFPGSHDST
jgi:hypothetical protein